MFERMTDELPLKALKMAIIRRIGQSQTSLQQLIFHSDQGSQYASNEFRAELQKHQISQCMPGKGNCYDNAPVESFMVTLKTEEVKPIGKGGYETRSQAKTAIFDYIETFYNRARRHTSNGYLSPWTWRPRTITMLGKWLNSDRPKTGQYQTDLKDPNVKNTRGCILEAVCFCKSILWRLCAAGYLSDKST